MRAAFGLIVALAGGVGPLAAGCGAGPKPRETPRETAQETGPEPGAAADAPTEPEMGGPSAVAGPKGAAASSSGASDAVASDVTPTDDAVRTREPGHRVEDLRITVLSTSVAPQGIGEWGFSALVEVDGHRILFDTGAKRQTVKRNAQALGIDLRSVPMVVLSHHHGDHVGGLLTLRRSVVEDDPTALATVHVAEGIFASRHRPDAAREVNRMVAIRPAYEQTGGTFIVHDGPAEIVPGVWLTGPVPRRHPERNWSGRRLIPGNEGDSKWIEDTLPESQSLVIETDRGLVVLSGCGHAGIVNTLAHARASIRDAPIHAAMGGFHLMHASAEHLDWTAQQLEGMGLRRFLGGHCTGSAAVKRMGRVSGMDPEGATVVGVGDRFELRSP